MNGPQRYADLFLAAQVRMWSQRGIRLLSIDSELLDAKGGMR